MITEADTCRKYVLPKLLAAGWDNDPHSFTEQRTFTDVRIVPKYAEHGTAQFVPPDALPPLSTHGNAVEIAKIFGGRENLRTAVTQLQTLLYAA